MSAAKEIETPSIQKLGVIAGSGELPAKLLKACDRQGIETFVVGFENHTPANLMEGRKHLWTQMGKAGQIVKTLQKHDVKDLVLIGSVRRPTLSELKPDLKAVNFFARIAMKALGDNDLLTALRAELERDGFTLHGVHKFADDLLAPSGVLGKHKPSKDDKVNIEYGIKASQALGELDIGQSIVVQQGFVLGVEAVEGTDALLQRCKTLKRGGHGGVLVKTCKPGQDLDLDLPTVGSDTLRKAHEAGLVGIAIHAQKTLIVDREELIDYANQHKLFVIGVDV